MIPHGSSSSKETIFGPSQADAESDRTSLTEEAAERALTSENFGMVTETTSPCYSGTTQTTTTDGMHRDSQNGLHKLPDEILIEIIRRAASDRRIDRKTQVLSDPTLLESLTSYREVCKRWKILVDGTPSLWAFLYAGDLPSVEALQGMIEKSGNAPLVVSCGRGLWTVGLRYFVNMVTPQMHRCKALWIKTGDLVHPSTIQPLVSQPCPILEELHFDSGHWWEVWVDGFDSHAVQDGTAPTYFDIWALRHNAGRLKALSLRRVMGWRTGPNLANLRELELDWPRIWFKDLMESLAESPLLCTLTIGHSIWEMYRSPEPATSVELAFLTRIELRDASASFTHSLLSHISPPSLKQLLIHIRDFDLPLFPLGDAGPGYQAFLLSLVKAQGAIPIPIEIGVRYQQLFIAEDQTGYEFELSGEVMWPNGRLVHFVQSLSNISRLWSRMSTPSFALLFGTKYPESQDEGIQITQECLRSLMDIEAVTEIRLGNMADNVQRLYHLLSDAVDDENKPRRWLLPRLATLEIEGHQDHDAALVEMLEARYATTGTVNAETLAPLPLSLLKIVRHSDEVPEPQIAERIRNSIGEEHFRIVDVYEDEYILDFE
ncbi:hypothetical protein FS837_011196 [Tulasnella sp. UAMH 9824]|nr:hypothetical protein FS837_011196 [Tulasnella sp. UAMH 9824]